MTTPINLLIFLLVTWLGVSEGQVNQAPRFQRDMNGHKIEENATLDLPVFELNGFDPEGLPVRYGIQSDHFIVPDPERGDVYLKDLLDFDNPKKPHQLLATVWISDGENKVNRSISVTVLDVNDNKPFFTEDTYKFSILENMRVGSALGRALEVQDVDQVGKVLNITCLDAQGSEGCAAFELQTQETSNYKWVGHLLLQRQLDYERAQLYQLTLEASDGVNRQAQSVEIELVDVQDTPPRFKSSVTASVDEGLRQGTVVITVVAEDGDKDSDREIRYSIVGKSDLFMINDKTGELMTLVRLDRESDLLARGTVSLTIQACEMVDETTVATDDLSCTTSPLAITVNDVNDRRPEFGQPVYEAEIPEDIADGVMVPGVQVTVIDADQSPRHDFEVSLNEFVDVFSITPAVGRGSLTSRIVIKNTSLIDYDLGKKEYQITLIAAETRTSEKLEDDAKLIIKITDVNDNKPVFPQSNYSASCSETAFSRTPVIKITATDADSGSYGTDGIRYKLVGNGANHFKVDAKTGQITVRGCFTPGEVNCLDREGKALYHLSFVAADNFGEGHQTVVPLYITLLDENDNPPRFSAPNYVSYILEGETVPDPPVQCEATDPDGGDNNRVRYELIGGDPQNLWQVHPVTGVVEAKRPVDYEDMPDDRGYYNLTVQASDKLFSATSMVQIFVIDTNDHIPQFTIKNIEETIDEDTPGGTLITRVVAIDKDPSTGPNGQIQYRISQGAQDKFACDPRSGFITVEQGAVFDYDTQKVYTLTVVASDQGQPQKSDEATVVINIRDANNKNPYFSPTTFRTEVLENRPIGWEVTTVAARDPDTDAKLFYTFLESGAEAYAPSGDRVSADDFDFMSLLRIVGETGVVEVNTDLDYERVARLSLPVHVRDQSGGAEQTATATLLVTVLEVNDRPPIFGPPWTPERPFIDVSVREAQSAGSYVTTLVASDPSDDIREYRLETNPGGHFAIHNTTGKVTVAVPLDYETDQSFQVVAVAVDDGDPSLTSTATINVEVININDENPMFDTEGLYTANVTENAPGGTSVVRVQASDRDLEDFGVVRYLLDPAQDQRFYIDELTGVIYVSPDAELDREKEPTISLTVKVYDSPNHAPAVRRNATVPVYITLLDENDNVPVWADVDYRKNVLENVPAGSSIFQLTATDLDLGENARVTFALEGGDPDGLFSVNASTGLVTTAGSLTGRVGVYNLSLAVTDLPTNPRRAPRVNLIIRVLPTNNGPPTWISPADDNHTVDVLENQYVGMSVVSVLATDEDVVTYGFMYNDEFVSETPEFKINDLTGVITARVEFDREAVDSYTLLLVARDGGSPPFSSYRYLTIRIRDTDDHDPQFPLDMPSCCAAPYTFSVREDTALESVLGRVLATDKDEGENAQISYRILNGNNAGTFSLDALTGELLLLKPLDYEVRSSYRLTIEAEDESGSDQDVPATCKCKNPGLVLVVVNVLDANDFPPRFAKSNFTACVPRDAELGTTVTHLRAVDADTGLSTGFDYTVLAERLVPEKGGFRDAWAVEGSGAVMTQRLMAMLEGHYFDMTVSASDSKQSSKAGLKIWVTSPSQKVVFTFKEEKEQVEPKLDAILKVISEKYSDGVVCVEDLRFFIGRDGAINPDWTELVVYVVDGGTLAVVEADLVVGALDDDAALGAYGVFAVAAAWGGWLGFVTWPIVAAVVVIAFLLLLGLLLCLLCCCCRDWAAYGGDAWVVDKQPIIHSDTINPLWKIGYNKQEYEDQELSMNMREQELINAGVINLGFDASALVNGSAGYNERRVETTAETTLTAAAVGHDTIDSVVNTDDVFLQAAAAEPRIEADLEPSPHSLNGVAGSTLHSERTFRYETTSTSFGARPSMVSESTMTDAGTSAAPMPPPADNDQMLSHARSVEYVPTAGISKIGATLTTSRRHQQVIGDNYSDLPPYTTVPRSNGPPPRIETSLDPTSYGSTYFGGSQYSGASGPVSPTVVATGLSEDQGESVYQGEIRLGTLPRPAGGYRETHEVHEYESGYIPQNENVFMYST